MSTLLQAELLRRLAELEVRVDWLAKLELRVDLLAKAVADALRETPKADTAASFDCKCEAKCPCGRTEGAP